MRALFRQTKTYLRGKQKKRVKNKNKIRMYIHVTEYGYNYYYPNRGILKSVFCFSLLAYVLCSFHIFKVRVGSHL